MYPTLVPQQSYQCIMIHTDIDECRSSMLHTCVNGRCDNTMGSFLCTCSPGFTSDGNNHCIGKNLLSYFPGVINL